MSPAAKRGPPTSALSTPSWRFLLPQLLPQDEQFREGPEGALILLVIPGCCGPTVEPDCVGRSANANAPGSSPGQAAAAQRASAQDGASQSGVFVDQQIIK